MMKTWELFWSRFRRDTRGNRSVEAGWRRYAFAALMLRSGQVGDEWNEPEVLGIGVPAESIPDYVLSTLKSRGCLKGNRVVEIGCGGGRFTQRLVDEFESVRAIDTSGVMLMLARKRVPSERVVFLKADGVSLPCEARSADCIFSFDCFVHLPIWSWAIYLEEAERVLTEHGVLIVHAGTLESELGLRRFATDVERWRSSQRYYWGAFSILGDDVVRDLARAAGLEVVDRWIDVVPRDVIFVLRRNLNASGTP